MKSEFLLSDDSYESSWCQIHTLRRLANYLGKMSTKDISIQANNWRFPLKPMKYKRQVVFYCGDEDGTRMPEPYNEDYLIVREINHKTLDYPNLIYKPLPINARNSMNGIPNATNDIEFSGSYLIPPLERPLDILFIGQFHVQDRRDMMQALGHLGDNALEKSKIIDTRQFAGGASMEDYSQMTERAKIILCPKGGAPETFRYTEAMKCGCTVITTFKPDNLWYYKGSPAIHLNHWSELTNELLTKLLEPQGLYNRGAKAVEYYNRCLSDSAVANYILKHLEDKHATN